MACCISCAFFGCKQRLVQNGESIVRVDTTSSLYMFYPCFKSLDLVYGEPPSEKDSTIIFCCGAAFTRSRMLTFNHLNIGGIHTSNGELFPGYICPENDGCFVFYDGNWQFSTDSILSCMEQAAKRKGIGFSQMMILPEQSADRHDMQDFFRVGIIRCYKDREGRTRIRKIKHQYRALCEKDGQLCVAELKEQGTFQEFVDALKEEHVDHAIYLDTGWGWGYAWYRASDEVVTLHPYIHPFVSNWLVFRK